ncbi:Os01g0188816 [Oryza sativa Japonica Group]|uniref:Os01g0188816 protein n=1 Tax=Oryza sativa subsp. japonica TaxID=39947 RepID=A0A0P0UZ98_ORYSJ|nr:Os01g0188816 [Oryza sativa Japonica Group]
MAHGAGACQAADRVVRGKELAGRPRTDVREGGGRANAGWRMPELEEVAVAATFRLRPHRTSDARSATPAPHPSVSAPATEVAGEVHGGRHRRACRGARVGAAAGSYSKNCCHHPRSGVLGLTRAHILRERACRWRGTA